MFSRTYRLWLSLLLIGCCLVGFYYRQVKTDLPPMEQVFSAAEETVSTREMVNLSAENAKHRSLFENDINTDFYQTIIDNNLFAPLGTVLNPTPKPGANLALVATFVSENIWRSTAVIKNETTGRHQILGIGDVFGDFTVMKIQPKQFNPSRSNSITMGIRLLSYASPNPSFSTQKGDR